MAKRGENIYKRKDGRYEGRYRLETGDGEHIRYGYVYAHTYREVKRRLGELKRAGEPDICPESISMERLSEMWLLAKRLTVKESTYARYASLLGSHILPELGQLQAEEMTAEQLGELLSSKLSEGLSGSTVRSIAGVLSSIFTYAQKELGLKNIALNLPKPKCGKSQSRMLEAEDWVRLRDYTMYGCDFSKLGVLLCLYTGIRIGELCALKVSNLQLDKGVLQIDATMQRIAKEGDEHHKTGVIITPPKSESSIREIPLPSFLIDKLKQVYRGVPANAYLLTGQCGRFVEPRTFQHRFKRYLQDCGIEDINFHALRHSFATKCIRTGADVKSVSEILGHSSINVTLGKYVHSSVEYKRCQIELLVASNN